jgi:hypothetical protein
MEHGYRDEQTHPNAKPAAGSVEEQLETIQDDVNLLKIEIKQTLVDLREFILNSQTGFLPRTNGAHPTPGPARDDPPYAESGRSRGKGANREEAGGRSKEDRPPDQELAPPGHPPVDSGGPGGRDFREDPRDDARGAGGPNVGYNSPAESYRRRPEATHQETLNQAREIGEIDVEMLVKLLAWLDSIKGKGISAEQGAPFLQAYEAKGMLTATMSTIILQSIRAIGPKAGDSGGAEYSAEAYLGYLQQLHGIVCGVDQGRISPPSEPPAGVRRIKAGPEAQS